MQETGIQYLSNIFRFVLNACTSLLALGEGQGIFHHVVELGFLSDAFVGANRHVWQI